MEDIGSIWLLHYHLIKTERASVYSLFFNEFLKEKPEFNKEKLKTWLLNRTEGKVSENTIDRDIDVLLRTYLKPKNSKSIEKDFVNIFVGLGLLIEKDRKLGIVIDEKPSLPAAIFLYTILDNPDFDNTNSISLKDLRFAKNSVGLIFSLTNDGIYQKIKELEQQYPALLIFTETAGNPVLQFKEKIDKKQILNDYYA